MEACSDSYISFGEGEEELAYIVENDIILDAIMKQVRLKHIRFC